MIRERTRTAFRAEGEQYSERSDAGTSIVPEVFGFVKQNRPEGSDSVRCLAAGWQAADLEQVSGVRGADWSCNRSGMMKKIDRGGLSCRFCGRRDGRLLMFAREPSISFQ